MKLLNWLQIISDLDEIILFQLMRYYEYGLDVVVVAIKTFTLWTGHWHWGDYLHNWLQSSLLLFHLSCVHPVLSTTAWSQQFYCLQIMKVVEEVYRKHWFISILMFMDFPLGLPSTRHRVIIWQEIYFHKMPKICEICDITFKTFTLNCLSCLL